MNRKKKILFATIGIFVILFAIIGITYAYFVARVQGNTSTVSIQTKAGILSLVYGEGQNDVIEATNILPGYTNTKNFTVTNNGSGTASYGVFLEELRNTFTRTSDLKLTVTCASNISGNTCNGLTQSDFPTQNDLIISNSIDKDEIQTYTLTLEYLNVDTNQNADNNASLFAKVQIYDLDSTVDLSGTVENSQPGDYVVVNSSPKRSEIVNGTFKVVGLEPDNHTINVYNESGTPKSTNTLTINSGTEESISGSTVTIVESSRTITTSVDAASNNSVTITDIERISINSEGGSGVLLADAIINNARNVTTEQKELLYAEYSETPKTTPAVDISGENESTLSKAEDDYGYSYYFRGNVANNYVNFADMCWRIVRIQGDNSIKLILEDQDEICSSTMNGNWDIPIVTGGSINTENFGYEEKLINSNTIKIINYLNPVTESNNAQTVTFKNFQTDMLSSYLSKLKPGNWCFGDTAYTANDGTGELIQDRNAFYSNNTAFYYDSWVRLVSSDLKSPTIRCNGTILNTFGDNSTPMYIGTITADEVAFSGGVSETVNNNYYLLNNYQKENELFFWLMTPALYEYDTESSFIIFNSGDISMDRVYYDNSIRPAIQLKTGTEIIEGGDGTQLNPYVIK